MCLDVKLQKEAIGAGLVKWILLEPCQIVRFVIFFTLHPTLTHHNFKNIEPTARDKIYTCSPWSYKTFLGITPEQNSQAQKVIARRVADLLDPPYTMLEIPLNKVGVGLTYPLLIFSEVYKLQVSRPKNRWSSGQNSPSSGRKRGTLKWPLFTWLNYRKILENERNPVFTDFWGTHTKQ